MERNTKQRVDWDMVIMCLVLAISLWVNTVTRPEVQIADKNANAVPNTTETVVTVVEEPTILEEIVDIVIPNYASGNTDDIDSIDNTEEEDSLEVVCPHCGVTLSIEEVQTEKQSQ